MEENSVADVLRALAKGKKARSETALLRDSFDEVEAALQAGVSRAAILEALQEKGFTMGLKGFESALYRIRKQRANKPATASIKNPVVDGSEKQTPKSVEKQIAEPATTDQDQQIGTEAVREALNADARNNKISQYGKKSILKQKE